MTDCVRKNLGMSDAAPQQPTPTTMKFCNLLSSEMLLLCITVVAICIDDYMLLPRNRFMMTAFVIVPAQQQSKRPLHRTRTTDNGRSGIISNSSSSSVDNDSEMQQKSIKRPPRPSPTGFSYVEGGVYTNMEEEIEAMGGDTSFLMMESSAPAPTTTPMVISNDAASSAESDLASPPPPPPAWEWDGVEVEDAYFDE